MQSEEFDTRNEQRSRQFDAWRSWWSGFATEMPEEEPGIGFPAYTRIWQLGDLSVTRVSAPALRAIRSKAHIRRAPYDHWNVVVGLCSETRMAVGSEQLVVPAGQPLVVSLGTEVISERDADDRIQLYLPRDQFADLAPILDRACGVVADTTAARLLADYIIALERRLPDLEPNGVPRLGAAIGTMVAACMQPSADLGHAAQQQIGFARVERVRRITRAHLRSPRLNTALLCREVGISRSQLYRLLEPHGGVTRWIQHQRLLECHTLLSDLSCTGTIAAVAQEFCFDDASTFSRVFRRKFGASPRDVRAAALAGMALSVPSDVEVESDGAFGLADYLSAPLTLHRNSTKSASRNSAAALVPA
jgi:AraC-like DNA-binding protein